MRRLTVIALAGAAALAVTVTAGALGRTEAPAPTVDTVAAPVPVDQIARAQERLRLVPGDWSTWAALAVAYVERGRVTADPTNYPRAEEAARRSLELRPRDNGDALVAQGALANARHDFAAARQFALEAVRVNDFDADAYAVLADAETQLGNAPAATAAVQRLLDVRPGLSGYARGSYDLEQRGQVAEATSLMRQALETASGPSDIAFCRVQLGDLAWHTGDLAGASREYTAGLAADPTSVALQRGRARVAAAEGRLDAGLADYADLTRRAPTTEYLIEYAGLLHAAGKATEARAQLDLATAAHALYTSSGGTDGLAGSVLALAKGDPATAVAEARAEWKRRQHADVADALAWALHHAGKDAEALPYAQRAIGTGARSATYLHHLGVIELALGQTAAGQAHVDAARLTNPHFALGVIR
jgi:tetratricopeptide (TPR) repeat protein